MDDVVELKRQGLSIRAISRMTGYDRKTISRYLAEPKNRPVYGPRAPAESKLELFKTYLRERLQAGVWNGGVFLRELRERNDSGGEVGYQMIGIMPDFLICLSWVTSSIPSTSAVAPINRS